MKEIKQPKAAKEKNVGKKVVGGIVFIAIMLIAYAILSMQQIGEIKNIAPETARALEDNEFAVTIIMKDKETGEALQGAVFKLEKLVPGFGTTYEQIGEYTTNVEGKIDLVLEKSVTYRITETTAPSGYKVIESTFNVLYLPPTMFTSALSVTGDAVTNGDAEYVDADGVIYVYNEYNGRIQIINTVDLDGNPLPGAVFSIAGTDYTTDGNGKIELEFEDGDYAITEIIAPDGYAKVKETINVSVQDGKWVLSGDYGDSVKLEKKELYIVNEPLTPVELNVVDGEGNPLEGAAFRVSYTDDTTVGEYTSDKEGKIKLELENGDYIIIQLTPIEGYVVAEPVNIRVTDGIYAVLNSDGTEKSEANKASVVVNDLKEIVINKVRRKWRVNSNTRCII